jgi:hypothetical protein
VSFHFWEHSFSSAVWINTELSGSLPWTLDPCLWWGQCAAKSEGGGEEARVCLVQADQGLGHWVRRVWQLYQVVSCLTGILLRTINNPQALRGNGFLEVLTFISSFDWNSTWCVAWMDNFGWFLILRRTVPVTNSSICNSTVWSPPINLNGMNLGQLLSANHHHYWVFLLLVEKQL